MCDYTHCLCTMIVRSQYFAGSLEILLEFGYSVYRLLSTSVNEVAVDKYYLVNARLSSVSEHSSPRCAYALRYKVGHNSLKEGKLVTQANAFRSSLVFFKQSAYIFPICKVNGTHFSCTLMNSNTILNREIVTPLHGEAQAAERNELGKS